MPAAWFAASAQSKRQRIGLPATDKFATKLEVALTLIKRLKKRGHVRLEAVDCDSLYGRKGWFRDQLQQLGLEYDADIPQDTRLYLERPQVTFPLTQRGKPSKPPEIRGIAYPAKELKTHPQTEWHTFTLRPAERGRLVADFARRRVWSVDADGTLRQEWLLIRQDPSDTTFSLSNASPDTPLD